MGMLPSAHQSGNKGGRTMPQVSTHAPTHRVVKILQRSSTRVGHDFIFIWTKIPSESFIISFETRFQNKVSPGRWSYWSGGQSKNVPLNYMRKGDTTMLD